MTIQKKADAAEPREFASFLIETSGGKTHAELTDALHDLVARVIDTGKKGTLTLVVAVEPMKDNPDMLVVSDEIKIKLPEHDRKASVFWADADGNLVRNDPRQRSFFDVELAEAPPANVNIATGEVQED